MFLWRNVYYITVLYSHQHCDQHWLLLCCFCNDKKEIVENYEHFSSLPPYALQTGKIPKSGNSVQRKQTWITFGYRPIVNGDGYWVFECWNQTWKVSKRHTESDKNNKTPRSTTKNISIAARPSVFYTWVWDSVNNSKRSCFKIAREQLFICWLQAIVVLHVNIINV